MNREYYIALDTHGSFSELAAVTTLGNLVRKGRCGTTIPALRALLEKVPRPRHLTFEEGPLANWLYRNLKEVVDSVTVAEPRRNRLIASEGDKDDDVDAEKLAQLFRGGYIKVVHQTETLDGSVFKQLVAEYHRQVRRRVAQSLQITALLKQHGIMAPSKVFAKAEDRSRLLEQLPSHACCSRWSRRCGLNSMRWLLARTAGVNAWCSAPSKMTLSCVSRKCRAWVGRAPRRCVSTLIRPGVFAVRKRCGATWASVWNVATPATARNSCVCRCR